MNTYEVYLNVGEPPTIKKKSDVGVWLITCHHNLCHCPTYYEKEIEWILHACTYTHIYKHINTHTRTHTHARAHTHTHTPPLVGGNIVRPYKR